MSETDEGNNCTHRPIEIRSKPVTLALFNSEPDSLLISLENTYADARYTIQYSRDLSKWFETGVSLEGDRDAPIVIDLPPINLQQEVDAIYLRLESPTLP